MMQLKNVVQAQREFFRTNRTKDIQFRKQQLQKLKEVIKEREALIYEALKKDLNKSEYEAYLTEVSIVLGEIKMALKHLDRWSRPNKKKNALAVKGNRSFTVHEPYGVVLVISPWNYPFHLALSPLVGAMAAGNCVILKTSRSSLHTTNVIYEMIRSSFDGQYLHVVEENCSYDALLAEKYDYIFFTGSSRVGRIIMRSASETLTPVCLELGGKSPCIVDESANLKDTAKKIIWGKLINAGQTCVAPDFVMVHESIKDDLIEELQKQIKELYDNPLENEDYPRIINLHHYMRLCRLIDRESEKIGGERDEATYRIAPTIFYNADFDSEIMNEEIFGPILPVIGFSEMEEMIWGLKQRPKPLACYIFTRDMQWAEQIITDLSFGGGCVNDCIMHLANEHLPFGGVGNSGIGRYHGYYSFCTFSHEKAILLNKGMMDLKHRFPPYTMEKLKILRRLLNK